jgi:hypothetical protein
VRSAELKLRRPYALLNDATLMISSRPMLIHVNPTDLSDTGNPLKLLHSWRTTSIRAVSRATRIAFVLFIR